MGAENGSEDNARGGGSAEGEKIEAPLPPARSMEEIATDMARLAQLDSDSLMRQFPEGIPAGMEKMVVKDPVRLSDMLPADDKKKA